MKLPPALRYELISAAEHCPLSIVLQSTHSLFCGCFVHNCSNYLLHRPFIARITFIIEKPVQYNLNMTPRITLLLPTFAVDHPSGRFPEKF